MDTTPLQQSPLTRGAPRWLAKIESAHLKPVDRTSANPWPGFLAGQAEKPVRVLLIDEDGNARRSIAHELLADARVCVAGEAGNLPEARRLLAQGEFDVLILDIRLGGGKGFDLIDVARQHCSSAEVIVHSTLDDEVHVRRAFAAGASGYLDKNSWFQNFTQAVLQVVNGGAAVSPNVTRHLLSRLGPVAPWQPADDGPLRRKLSVREREVLLLVAKGHLTQDIAHQLSISAQTVCSHMKNICRKLQVHTRAHAVTMATSLGLL
ncbi:DNA-binding NarL/FixJ family response regulator [Variovorax boronicumulans]|uniref:response regulator transcription factor n=1 Tax=Variovorax boronicumulans TaxID=436515 RepID=UPI002473BEDF|nr:response regulator transcription factor [Variovorax boronicumulans]MDH6169143.1 DNA-binding NarL/FixJ family response regulator [Variovorax boronicumulans]